MPFDASNFVYTVHRATFADRVSASLQGTSTFLHGRLERISKNACARLRESLIHAGNVSPVPIQEAGRPARALTVERRRSKSVRPPAAR